VTRLITSHVWRKFNSISRPHGVAPGACAYMSCRRPRAEHERAVSGRLGRPLS
jgi:hypothetical protein